MNGEGKAVFKSYTVKDGLPSDILLSVEEDDTGNLWISTENGLSKFIPSEQRFENYNERDFGGKIRFEEGTSLNLSSSTLLFGTSRGMLYFEPEHIKKKQLCSIHCFRNVENIQSGGDSGCIRQFVATVS